MDKYQPKSYLDLVSSESTNREVLEWITQVEKMNCGQKLPPKKEQEKVWRPWGYAKVDAKVPGDEEPQVGVPGIIWR